MQGRGRGEYLQDIEYQVKCVNKCDKTPFINVYVFLSVYRYM